MASSLNAKLLKVGSFIHPQNGVTFYIGGISTSGVIEDVFVLDERNKDREIIITSKSGYLITNNNNRKLRISELCQSKFRKQQSATTTLFVVVCFFMFVSEHRQSHMAGFETTV